MSRFQVRDASVVEQLHGHHPPASGRRHDRYPGRRIRLGARVTSAVLRISMYQENGLLALANLALANLA